MRAYVWSEPVLMATMFVRPPTCSGVIESYKTPEWPSPSSPLKLEPQQ